MNRATVTAAYELLETEGLITSHVGRGSFVAQSPHPPRWDRLLATSSLDFPGASVASSRDEISFATSRPSEELFPLEEFRATLSEVFAEDRSRAILQLGSPLGYEPLRAYLLEQARRQGTARPVDDIVITSGCQQALDLLQRVLVQSDETVLVEDPVYPGLRQVFARAGVRVVGVPVGDHGVETEGLDRIAAGSKAKLMVVTPNFQNPTGATLPPAGRTALLKSCQQAGMVLVESDIYGELRYEGAAPDSLKSMDETGGVIRAGSFSKIAFPGLRVGWVIAPRAVTARLAEAKQWTDLHTDQLAQAVLLRFAESGRLARHLRSVIDAGAQRLHAALEACAAWLPGGSTFTRPQGGMNLWLTLPEPLDAAGLLPRARREGVGYLPGRYFAVSRPHTGSLRLSFAGLPPDRIRAGIEILGRVFASELERARPLDHLEPVPAVV